MAKTPESSAATSIERTLRDTSRRFRGWSYSGDADPDPRVLMVEAANEIERLREELAKLEDRVLTFGSRRG